MRYINPSPYMFFLHLDDTVLVGSSPETMVRLENRIATLRPIAGTRPRGRTEQEDRQLADELLRDEKERAEHLMLVDLGRNDLGRVADIGSVQVNDLMVVERYSHVMHLVSNIRCDLEQGLDAFDLLKAAFPAGTLSGAPKIRAMEIIAGLEDGAARALRRGRGLSLVQRQHGHGHHHPHGLHHGRQTLGAGRRRHCGGLGPRARTPGDRQQGPGAAKSPRTHHPGTHRLREDPPCWS